MKQLLIKLLDFLEKENPIDGEYITTDSSEAAGLCSLLKQMCRENIITSKEFEQIYKFLNTEIKSKYNHYPVIYVFCDYGSKESLFFFQPKNWTIRKKWLNEVINKM